jgi:chromosome segregation ATPase
MLRQTVALTAVLLALPLAAQAQSYRCVGADGKKYYGQTIPPQCAGQVIEQLSPQGLVVRRIDPQATAAQRAAKQAEVDAKKKEDATAKEEQRRAKALLATYTSEKDVDLARQRALEDNDKAVKEIEARVGTLKKRLDELQKELDFFQGKKKPPAKLEQDVKSADIDLKAQEGLLAAKQKNVDAINAKYDDDKKRYIELTRGSSK